MKPKTSPAREVVLATKNKLEFEDLFKVGGPLHGIRYKPIPIAAAKHIAKIYGKAQVAIVAWDNVHLKTHVTTYGISKQDCREAAHLGNIIKRDALKWPAAECNAVPRERKRK